MPQHSKREPKFVILDANVLIGDYWLRSPSFLLLREFLKNSKATLVIPKIVFEEVVNHHREDVRKLKADIQDNLRESGRLLRDTSGGKWLIELNRRQANDSYEKFLSTELTNLGAVIPDYGNIPHSEIVKRDLRRRRPFQQSGKGYRDALLWETILRGYVLPDALTVIVTQNSKDFSGGDDALHKDLLEDISSLRKGFTPHVVLSPSLLTFTDTYIVPHLTRRKEFAVLVQNNKVQGLALGEVCERYMDALVTAVNEDRRVMTDSSYDPEVDVIDLSDDYVVDQVSEVSKNVLLVEFGFSAYVSFTYFLPRSDYYTMDEKETENIAVLDPNWNEYVMQVESSAMISFSCRLTFNTKTKKVESFEVDRVEEAA